MFIIAVIYTGINLITVFGLHFFVLFEDDDKGNAITLLF